MFTHPLLTEGVDEASRLFVCLNFDKWANGVVLIKFYLINNMRRYKMLHKEPLRF
jgi:hypothetical protein